MTEYFIPQVGIVQPGQGFRLPDGRQFNGAYLAGAEPDARAAIGAVPVNRQPRPVVDERTHRVIEHQDGENITYTVEPIEPAEIAADIARRALDAATAIDTLAEQTRLLFVTPGSAQAMVYQAKMDEAKKWAEAGQPADLSAYPLIAAEIGINGATAAEVTALWTQMEATWRALAASIEAARLGGKKAIEQARLASDFDGIDAARNTAIAAFAALAQPPA